MYIYIGGALDLYLSVCKRDTDNEGNRFSGFSVWENLAAGQRYLRYSAHDFREYLRNGRRCYYRRAHRHFYRRVYGAVLSEKALPYDEAGGGAFSWDSFRYLRILRHGEAAIRAVPESYYEGALALGATHERSVFFTVVPAAKSGIFASVVLGIGRALGETMAVIMVVGNQARMPKGLLKGVRTLTANIVTEMGYAADLHREALIATAVVLFIFILIINVSLSLIKRRSR